MMKLTRPVIAAIVLLVVALLAIPTTAAAQSRAVARSVVQATTATWGAVAVAPGAQASPGAPFVINSSGWSSSTHYFDVVNVGTMPLTGQMLSFDILDTWFGGTRNPSLAVEGCINGTWTSSSRCSGTKVFSSSVNNGAFSSSLALEPGQRVNIKLGIGWSWTGIRTTIDVSVARTMIRKPVTHNN